MYYTPGQVLCPLQSCHFQAVFLNKIANSFLFKSAEFHFYSNTCSPGSSVPVLQNRQTKGVVPSRRTRCPDRAADALGTSSGDFGLPALSKRSAEILRRLCLLRMTASPQHDAEACSRSLFISAFRKNAVPTIPHSEFQTTNSIAIRQAAQNCSFPFVQKLQSLFSAQSRLSGRKRA